MERSTCEYRAKKWVRSLGFVICTISLIPIIGCVWKVSNNFSDELDLQERGYHQLNGKFGLFSNKIRVKSLLIR